MTVRRGQFALKLNRALNSPVKRGASLIALLGLLVLMVDIAIFLSFHSSHIGFWDSQIGDYGRSMYRSYAIWGYGAGMLLLLGLLGSIFSDATVRRIIGWIRDGSL